MTAERIRDKIAASKRKGLWMGGNVPLGYDPDGRTLTINEGEAKTVRTLYDLYEQHGTVRAVRERADGRGLRSRRRTSADGTTTGGGPFDRGHLHHILTNPIYAGRIRHRDKVFEGQHPAIIQPETWEAVQAQLQNGAAKRRSKTTGMTGRDAPTTLVAWNLIVSVPIAAIPASLYWTPPQADAWVLLALQGVLGGLNMGLVTRAFSLSEASLLVPIEFLRLPLVAALAYVAFGEVVAVTTWFGACTIFAATLLMVVSARHCEPHDTHPITGTSDRDNKGRGH